MYVITKFEHVFEKDRDQSTLVNLISLLRTNLR
jgi:hypothetical protein